MKYSAIRYETQGTDLYTVFIFCKLEDLKPDMMQISSQDPQYALGNWVTTNFGSNLVEWIH